MSGVLHLCNVLQFIIHRFYNNSLSEQDPIMYTHYSSFHVTFQSRNKLYSINKKSLKEVPTNVALDADQLPMYEIYITLSESFGIYFDVNNSKKREKHLLYKIFQYLCSQRHNTISTYRNYNNQAINKTFIKYNNEQNISFSNYGQLCIICKRH